MEYLPEAAIVATLAVTGYFCRSVLAELKQIRLDLHSMALNHVERIVKLEANYGGASKR